MAIAGQVVLFKFSQTNLVIGKLRPALLIKPIPNNYQDWLTCMISGKTGQEIVSLDMIITANAPNFQQTGLKSASIIRLSRLAVISESILLGNIGNISASRLQTIKDQLSAWILDV